MKESKNPFSHLKRLALLQGMLERDINKIIVTMYEAAFEYGLRADELNGVFLALEQMVIKNKVSTEDFRIQLGGNIPGVVNIMADALGISIIELDRMIKNSELISCDVLPKFADMLNVVLKE
jgi:tape measure domain-containing protein